MNWMLSTPLPLIIVTVLYLCQAIAYVKTGDKGMSLAFVAYDLANVGFIWSWYAKYPT